jgi:hypothetical protein
MASCRIPGTVLDDSTEDGCSIIVANVSASEGDGIVDVLVSRCNQFQTAVERSYSP